MDAKALLKIHVSKTSVLTDAEFEYFFSYFKSQRFKKKQVVFKVGARVDAEYFVISGCLKSFLVSPEKKTCILQFAMPTWWVSDYHALYQNEKATMTLDCISDAEVLSLTNHDREKLCSELHQVERFFRLRTNKGFVATQQRLLSVMSNDVKHRYEALLQQYPELYNMVPKNLIAAYLGVSRETLSRLYNTD
jgi:CRP-like cAMP-binding protein